MVQKDTKYMSTFSFKPYKGKSKYSKHSTTVNYYTVSNPIRESQNIS